MRSLSLPFLLLACVVPAAGGGAESVYDFTVADIEGNPVSLDRYQGLVILIVNVASRCGFTPQYAGLQKIYERYRERGFVVLGFPANNFLGQEPGTGSQIKEFCTLSYGVTFPLFSKISVKGRDIHPLFELLTDKKKNPMYGGPVTWNFNKFLVDREGKVIARFGSRVPPEHTEVLEALERALEK